MLNRTMTKLRTPKAEREEGFTLIELLVVVVIIGILIAIAIPVYLNYQKGAANKSAGSDARNAVAAVEQCATTNNNAYPATLTVNGVGNGTGTGTGNLSCGGTPVQTIQVNVSPNNGLVYAPAADTKSYTITATAGGRGSQVFKYDSSTGQTSATG